MGMLHVCTSIMGRLGLNLDLPGTGSQQMLREGEGKALEQEGHGAHIRPGLGAP